MRICVLIDAWKPVWGGGQTHVIELTRSLAVSYGYKFDIFTRALSAGGRNYSGIETALHGHIRIFRIGPVTDFFNVAGRLGWLAAVTIAVWHIHRQHPYALLHAHAFSAGIPGKVLSILLGIPVVFSVHGSHNLDLGKHTLTATIENLLLTKISYDKVISVSANFLKYHNINSDIAVIPNGVTVENFDKISRSKKRSATFKILWVGRFDQYKGLDILLRAFANFSKIEKNTVLTLVGDGPEKGKIITLIYDLALDRQIKLIPRRTGKELVTYYKSSDIFVLPSLAEGQPIVLLEAWAAGLPVIATDVGDNRRFVADRVNGYLISSGSVAELTQALVKAKRNKNLERLATAGYNMVKSNYTWDIIAEKYSQVYQKYV